ncbi:phytoene/squalene synthase family protein [Streptomyces sp. NPDC007205]|uniref:phytoene/squalene synthase family protein n=1 Tax=Streptomyces sp. NPDC007205 TaxID=3154316 RepID=UPI0033F1829F
MIRRELDAAGITDPALRSAYTTCRHINARQGKSFFLATRLLPTHLRPAMHALYGFNRRADNLIDDMHSTGTAGERARALDQLQQQLSAGLRGERADDPVVRAAAHTAARYAIDHQYFTDFITAMRSDLEVTDYPDYDALRVYMHGAAVTIGLQAMAVLGTVVPAPEAVPYATALAEAFQLTNIVRDVGEDLDRGRIYLPTDLLAAHGVDRGLLEWSRRTGQEDRRIGTALESAAELARSAYLEAAPGIALIDPPSQPAIRTASILYAGILDNVADQGYTVLHRRAVPGRRRRISIALGVLARVAAARVHPRTAGIRP